MRLTRILLAVVALACFGVALSYPIRYHLAQRRNDGALEQLAEMRAKVQDAAQAPETEGGATAAMETRATAAAEAAGAPEAAGTAAAPEAPMDTAAAAPVPPGDAAVPAPEPTPVPTLDPYYWDLTRYEEFFDWVTPEPEAAARSGGKGGAAVTPAPTVDYYARAGALPYPMKEKKVLDEAAMLPELKEIYALNHDLVGWINVPGTVIDYPVVQTRDSEFYLTHDFYGEENVNGQIILDTLCDPYTPSYNLVISGHHMKNGSMFGDLPEYRARSYWEKHKLVAFDTLMERKRYVVFAAFYSADYDEDEAGFRYNANIEYLIDARQWLAEIRENQLYDTGVEAGFGDEFITLTTCNRARHRNGRFVVVCRRLREGETFE